jgi:hypothetical protein
VFCKPHPPNRCIEAICITVIVEGDPEWKTKKVNITKLEELISQYFNLQEENDTKKLWIKYIQKFAKKEGNKVVNELMKNWHTWDLYSVNRIFCETTTQVILKNVIHPGEPYEKMVYG